MADFKTTANNDLAWSIYQALVDRGSGIGTASVGIIERELDRAEAERWIPVSERLPELTQFADSDHTGFSDPVLIWITDEEWDDGDGLCDVAQYHYSGNPNLRSGWLTGSGYVMHTVTHWRAQPEGPTE